MLLKFQGYRSAAPPGATRRRTPRQAQPGPVCTPLLLDSLQMFFELGLTPHEMSRLSGLPLGEVEDGLHRLKKAG